MAKYSINDNSIDIYFKTAVDKMIKHTNKLNKEQKITLNNDPSYIVTNFFDLPHNLKKNIILKKNDKDYHIILKKLEEPQQKADLWLHRLRNVCSALKYCANIGYDNFELAIFGSETYKSDIDIGVSYIKGKDINKPLSMMVREFENYFVRKGYTSLDIDVEMYADYFIKNGSPFIQTDHNIYNSCLPFIVGGVIKNYIQAIIHTNLYCDVRRKIVKNNKNCIKELKKLFDSKN